MDNVSDYIVEWFDGDNGPFRHGYDKLPDAQVHAGIVGGKVLDNTSAANAVRAAHQEQVDADAAKLADEQAQRDAQTLASA
jgi:hypothetical protein